MWEHFAPGGAIRVGGHHFAERFLRRGDDVAWCVGPVSPWNFVRASDESRARLRLWMAEGERYAGGRMFAYAPMTLLPYRRRPLFDHRFVAANTLRATLPGFDGIMERAGFGAPQLIFMEPGAPHLALLDAWPRALSVYRMCDDTGGFPDAPRTFPAIEAEVCRRVDLVVATAGSLLERAQALGARRAMHLPNACDPEPFAAAGLAPPSDLLALPRPRAIYAGAIDSWFDADLVAATARRLPTWSFVLIGPARGALPALAGIPNVHLLGPRPYAELGGYFAGADAAMVPFRLTGMTHAIHPIKVYEYLAAGLPVVSTPMRETAAMGAPIALAEGEEEFARALETARTAPDGAVRGGLEAARAERRAFARRNSWDDRFARLAAAIDGVSGREAPPARLPREAEPAGPRRAAGGAR